MAFDEPFEFDIAKLCDTHVTKRFKAGGEECLPLKTFLQRQALNFQNAQVAQTYVAVTGKHPEGQSDTRQVIGYVTLTCSEISLEQTYQLQDCPIANNYPTLPAVKIARLAIDATHRGKGIGQELVDLAISIAKDEIGTMAGCRFIATDAKQGAVSFYEKQGFTHLDSQSNNEREQPIMFIDLALV